MLDSNFPLTATVRGFSDNRLPFNSRFSGNLSLDQEFALGGRSTGFVGASASYLGNRLGVFQGPGMSAPGPSRPRQYYPGFAKFDFRAGVRREAWTANLFVNNIADKRGAVAGGIGDAFATSLNYIQPRTVGLSVSWDFE